MLQFRDLLNNCIGPIKARPLPMGGMETIGSLTRSPVIESTGEVDGKVVRKATRKLALMVGVTCFAATKEKKTESPDRNARVAITVARHGTEIRAAAE
jgi:hypothetical protein